MSNYTTKSFIELGIHNWQDLSKFIAQNSVCSILLRSFGADFSVKKLSDKAILVSYGGSSTFGSGSSGWKNTNSQKLTSWLPKSVATFTEGSNVVFYSDGRIDLCIWCKVAEWFVKKNQKMF